MTKHMKILGGLARPDLGLLLLRVVLGVVFIFHGYGKLFGGAPGMEAFISMVTKMGLPAPALLAYLAALSEFVGGILMLLGVWTGLAGAMIALVMFVAIAFAKKFQYPMIEIDLGMLSMALAVAISGAGKYSLEEKMRK